MEQLGKTHVALYLTLCVYFSLVSQTALEATDFLVIAFMIVLRSHLLSEILCSVCVILAFTPQMNRTRARSEADWDPPFSSSLSPVIWLAPDKFHTSPINQIQKAIIQSVFFFFTMFYLGFA